MAAFWGVLCKLHHHSSDKLGVADIHLSKIVNYGLQSVTQTNATHHKPVYIITDYDCHSS